MPDSVPAPASISTCEAEGHKLGHRLGGGRDAAFTRASLSCNADLHAHLPLCTAPVAPHRIARPARRRALVFVA